VTYPALKGKFMLLMQIINNSYHGRMDIEQIRCFLSVAELQSFSAAARRHFVTQPAVSLRIRALESTVGETLFERGGPGLRLTAAGELFRERCREAVRALDRGLSEVGDLKGLKRGRLAVGAIDAAGIYLLPALFRSFHSLHPGIDLVVAVEPSVSLVTGVVGRRLDCAVITLPACRPDLDVVPLGEETLLLVAPPGASSRVAAVFDAFPLIAYPPASVTRGLIDAALAARGITPRTAMEMSHPEAILRMVEAGLGAAVLPETIVDRATARLTRVKAFAVRRRLGLISRSGETPSPAARVFIGMVRADGLKSAGKPRSPAGKSSRRSGVY
jgi:DNA-binding transcriptional LysR family regulator